MNKLGPPESPVLAITLLGPLDRSKTNGSKEHIMANDWHQDHSGGPKDVLVRSRSPLYRFITGEDKADKDKLATKFQSGINPYRSKSNPLFTLVKGNAEASRPRVQMDS